MKKVALITGGARGIGFGISQELAKLGYDLVLCGRRSGRDTLESVSALKKYNVDVEYIECDISIGASRGAMIEAIKSCFGQLNLLINNAGIAPQTRSDILECTEESYERVMGVNLKGPYFLTQSIAKWMIEQKSQTPDKFYSIINISSISSTFASVTRGEYCLSKAGMSMMTKLFSVRLGEHNIPVYEIRPGIIETDMTSGVKEKYDKLIGDGLLLQSRWGVPQDIGRAVASLSKGDFLYSTGQVIDVAGGLCIERL